MNRGCLGLALIALPLSAALAAPWTFDTALPVTTSPQQGPMFHHLDASGRRNIAAGARGVAVAWEDDRDGTPRIYIAYKDFAASRFAVELQVSGAEEAYEPSLVALGGERFAIAWEEAGEVWVRLAQLGESPRLGPLHKLSRGQGAQASLSAEGDRLQALWVEREGRFGRIRLRRLQTQALALVPRADCPVDAAPPIDEQLYPAATLLRDRLLVAWEDRRPGHTIIMAAAERQPGSCSFGEPVRISEKPKGGGNLPYGAGHGVSRVAVDRVGQDEAFAAWADKRSFRNGYDIWGAFYRIGDAAFGANQRVQDDFGGLAKQRHATVAGDAAGRLVVAWDDEREGNLDLLLSWRDGDGWSEDWPLPVAAGEGQQSNPSIVLDSRGNLHAAWIERDEIGGPTRLLYGFGRLNGSETDGAEGVGGR